MDFEKICMMFTLQEPFYGIILSSMRRQAINNPKIMPTIGVRRSKDSFLLGYNPEFIEGKSVETIMQLLKHEVLHVAFGHLTTVWNSYDCVSESEHKLRNAAEDLEVNCYINKTPLVADGMRGMFVEEFGWEKSLGTREYYKLLKEFAEQMAEQQKVKQSVKSSGNGNGAGTSSMNDNDDNQDEDEDMDDNSEEQATSDEDNEDENNDSQNDDMENDENDTADNNGNDSSKGDDINDANEQLANDLEDRMFDDHSDWPRDNEGTQDLETTQEIVDTLLDFAAQECEKSHGDIPGEMVGRIEQIRKKPKPATDWKRYFRRYLGNEFTEMIRKSKKRESRRYPDAAGNRHQRKSHILVAIDTSGSVSMPEYREFFGQIRTLTDRATFHVVECDACIQHEYDYNGHPNEVLHGGGGTSFEPVIDLFIKDRKKYDALVYFTDGYATIPLNTPKETLWVISSNGDKKNNYRTNGASVVFIPKHQ